jgi:hypothetical protein
MSPLYGSMLNTLSRPPLFNSSTDWLLHKYLGIKIFVHQHAASQKFRRKQWSSLFFIA